MRDLLIFPFNGNGLEALSCLGNNYNFLGFVDDTVEKQGQHSSGFKVYPRSAFTEFEAAMVLAVPGSPVSYQQRKTLIASLGIPADRFATVVHPSAQVSPLAQTGFNTLIMAGVVLTSNCKIGDHVCILPNTVVHHDSSVGDFTLIGSNVTIAGNTSIGELCYIGSGTSVINGISIGDGTLIGMGSNVIRSVPANMKAAGNPAKILV
jgi:sugar O-acyltransferase (sialic acid O-acetyltransferase NeuD family)